MEQTAIFTNIKTGEKRAIKRSEIEQYGITPEQFEAKVAQTAQTAPTDQRNIIQKAGDAIVPLIKSNVVDPVARTGGMAVDYARYALAKTPEEKKRIGEEYGKKYAEQEQWAGKTGFGTAEDPGFKPGRYAKASGQTALEAASLLTPAGKGLKGAAAMGAASGLMRGVSEANTPMEVITKGVSGMVGGGTFGAGANVVGQGLSKMGSNMALKGLRPSATEQSKFLDKTGKQLEDYVIKNNLFDKGTDKIDDLMHPLQQSFDDIAVKSMTPIKKTSVVDALLKKADGLMKSTVPELKRKGEKIFEIADNINSKYGDDITSDVLTAERRAFDSASKEFGRDLSEAGANQIVRDTLQDSIQQATSHLKGANGQSLKEIGIKLRDMHAFRDIASLKQFIGKGNLPVGLMPILSIIAGGGIGGAGGAISGRDTNSAITGALAGAGLVSLANHPKSIELMVKSLKGLGKMATTPLATKGAQTLGAMGGIETQKMFTPRTLPPIEQALSPETSQAPTLDMGQTEIEPSFEITNSQTGEKKTVKKSELSQYGLDENGQPAQQQAPQELNFTPEQISQGYMRAMQAGDTKAAEQLAKMYDMQVKVGKATLDQNKVEQEVNSVSETVGLVDTILGRPLDPVTGAIRFESSIPGTQGYGTQRMIDQLKNKLSLAERQKMKGQGQISDFESKMLANSVTALDPGMSKEDFVTELYKIRQILDKKSQVPTVDNTQYLPDIQNITQ